MIRNSVCKTPWSRLETIHAAKDKPATSAELVIEGPIGWDIEKWCEGEKQTNTKEYIRKELKALAELKVDNLTVRINSLGGSVLHGLSIHDLLKEHAATVTTIVEGMTASAATVIAQAGDVRKISANALYLIHKPLSFAFGNANDMQQTIEDLAAAEKRLVDIYTKRGASPKAVADLMAAHNGNGRWLDAEEAKAAGLVDEVYEPRAMAACAPPPDMVARYGLPPLPEQTAQRSTPGANAPSSQPKTEPKAMDKQQIANLKATFGAEFALAQIEAETPYEQAVEAGARDLADRLTALSAERDTLATERDALAAQVAALEAAAADPLAPSAQREPETDAAAPLPIPEAHAALVKAGKTPAAAWAELRVTRPDDYAAHFSM